MSLSPRVGLLEQNLVSVSVAFLALVALLQLAVHLSFCRFIQGACATSGEGLYEGMNHALMHTCTPSGNLVTTVASREPSICFIGDLNPPLGPDRHLF